MIRQAGERALARGMRTRECLECLAETRRRIGPHIPIVPMTYASILEAYGYELFREDARLAGATSLIVADLPLEAAPEIPRVQLVAPTSTDERIRSAAERTDGWLYLVSLTGTTGTRDAVSSQLAGLVQRARALTDLELLAGFGISTAEQAADVATLADGIVVGSRPIQVADESGPKASATSSRRCAARSTPSPPRPPDRDVPDGPGSALSEGPPRATTRFER